MLYVEAQEWKGAYGCARGGKPPGGGVRAPDNEYRLHVALFQGRRRGYLLGAPVGGRVARRRRTAERAFYDGTA